MHTYDRLELGNNGVRTEAGLAVSLECETHLMDTSRIRGGSMRSGSVRVRGFKHLAVPAIATSLLFPVEMSLSNVPDIEDVSVLCDVIRRLNGTADIRGDTLTLNTEFASGWRIPTELSSRIHGCIYLIPVLLGRFGRVELNESGGCRIGPTAEGRRPLHHIGQVLERFGATVDCTPTSLKASCKSLTAVEIDILDWSDDRDEPNG